MYCIKDLNTTVTIYDHIKKYSVDIDTLIMDDLKSRFEGKCYQMCKIIEVQKILRKGLFTYLEDHHRAPVSGSVQFQAKCLIVAENSVLCGAKVIKIHKDGTIVCTADNGISIYIKASQKLQSIIEGQIIPVRVGKVIHNVLKSDISVNAFPFVPNPSAPIVIYKVKMPSKSALTQALQPRMSELDSMMEKMTKQAAESKEIKEVQSFFMDLVYPFVASDADIRSVLKKIYGTIKPLSDFMDNERDIKDQTIYIARPEFVRFDKLYVVECNLPPSYIEEGDLLRNESLMFLPGGTGTHAKYMIVTEGYEIIFSSFVANYIQYMEVIYNLTETYNTMQLVKKNNNVWDIYRKHKHSI
jgi:hypothetical protein